MPKLRLRLFDPIFSGDPPEFEIDCDAVRLANGSPAAIAVTVDGQESIVGRIDGKRFVSYVIAGDDIVDHRYLSLEVNPI